MADLNLKYGFNFEMDGVRKDPEGNLLVFCHYGVKPKNECKVVLLDPNENSSDEYILKMYHEAFPNRDLDCLIADIFEKYNPNSTLWIDDLSDYDNSPIMFKDVVCYVRFSNGKVIKYISHKEVCFGARVKVSGVMNHDVGVVIGICDDTKGRYETVIEVLEGVEDIKPLVSKPNKTGFVNKYIWESKNDSDYAESIFSDGELTAFWNLNFKKACVLLDKMELDADSCIYPHDDKLVNIFYLAIIKYLIKKDNIDVNLVKNYIDELVKKGWSFNKYKRNILNIISLLKHVKNKTELEQLEKLISEENE